MNLTNFNNASLRKKFWCTLLSFLVLSLLLLPSHSPANATQTKSAQTKSAKEKTASAKKNATNRLPAPPPTPAFVVRDDLHGISLETQKTIFAGEPFLLTLRGPASLNKVRFVWGKKNFKVLADKKEGGTKVLAFFSVPLDSKDSSLTLKVYADTSNGKYSHELTLPVGHRIYPEQRLTVAKKFVNPSKEEQERIKRESKIINAALSGLSPTRYWSVPLFRPVPINKPESGTKGEVSSVYGLRRFFNGEERAPHKGVDFDAKKNDPIHAAMDGKVVLVGDFFYSGRCVFVDHGLGVFTSYLHMTDPLVSEGQRVKRGQVLGLVGSTGRSTGPHLHFGFTVLGSTVNPAPFMPDLF